jgi:hypothetical protein
VKQAEAGDEGGTKEYVFDCRFHQRASTVVSRPFSTTGGYAAMYIISSLGSEVFSIALGCVSTVYKDKGPPLLPVVA